jgi:hypothetical protein
MATVVAAIGGLNILLGLFGLLFPALLTRLAARMWRTRHGGHLATFLRLLISTLLVIGAPYCRWPLTLQIIGILSLITALQVVFLSRERYVELREWLLSRPASFIRYSSVFGMLFGILIIQAAGTP